MKDRVTMKAAVMVDKNKVEYREISTPSISENEILIKVHAIGICGTDLHFLRGIRKVEFPHISGHEVSGEVVSMGSSAKDFSLGEQVVIDPNIHCGRCSYCRHGHFNLCANKRVIGVSIPGCFAEFVKAPQENVWKLPPSIDYWKGALVEPMAVALHAVQKAGVKLGENVALFGAGTIGLLLVQLLKASGAYVTVIDKIEKKLIIARELGADKIVNAAKNNFQSFLNSAELFHKVIDAAGVPQTFEESVRIASPGGTVIWLGLPNATVNIQTFPFLYRELSICSSLAYTYEFEESLLLMKNDEVKLEPLVTHRFNFDQIPDALEALRRGEAIKSIIILQN